MGGAISTPEWMTVDATARTVTMDIQAGGSDVNNYWNYNGCTRATARSRSRRATR